ncbi:3beta-hydroxysteroid-dehydrogenase/decarboxylase-like isoform X1 [Miscanthus floridulus]|uniref:3beta-hydroxysteroid- dehydrogenase/decarboxylase-like isoform X1 n=1 Tax=Miscanthus floridulus TaxID=154761 RepID=UPI00345AE890
MAGMWCAVTGGRGFMARYLVAALLRSGDWRVRVVDLAPTVVLGAGEAEELLGAAIQDGRASYIQGDVRNLAQITKAFEGVHVVFHTAAPDAINENFELHYSVNVEGTKNVVEACIMCKVKRLIYTSSSGVVFDGVHGLFDADESMPYPFKFVDAYTQTKAEGEKIVMKANGTTGLLTCCIRPGNIFGPGGKNIPRLASSRIWKFMLILGSGKNYDDFVFVENVAHGHICAEKTLSSEEGAKIAGGQTYFITNMEPVNMWDFVSLVQEYLGYKSQFRIKVPVPVIMVTAYVVHWLCKAILPIRVSQSLMFTPAKMKYAILNRTFSCKRANDQLGYKPVVSLKDGLKITLESCHNLHAQGLLRK